MVRDHFVYRLFDADGRLLYVGCTRNLTRRWKEHRTDKPRMAEATTRCRLQGPYTRAVARAIEREAIRTEDPFINWTPEKNKVARLRGKWIQQKIQHLKLEGYSTEKAAEAAIRMADLLHPDPYDEADRFLRVGRYYLRAVPA